MKTCKTCKIEKPFTEFYKRSPGSDKYFPYCKKCCSIRNTERYSINREKERKQQAEYNAKNKEAIREYQKEVYARDRSARLAKRAIRYAENTEKELAAQAKHRAKCPEKIAGNKRNRRAMARGAEGKHTAVDIARIFGNQRGLCANCHVKLLKSGAKKYHVDHIVPLIRGGSNWPDNLQCLCPTCNLSKGAKDPLEWAAQNGRLF